MFNGPVRAQPTTSTGRSLYRMKNMVSSANKRAYTRQEGKTVRDYKRFERQSNRMQCMDLV